jgi:hypothetical protein
MWPRQVVIVVITVPIRDGASVHFCVSVKCECKGHTHLRAHTHTITYTHTSTLHVCEMQRQMDNTAMQQTKYSFAASPLDTMAVH